MFVGNETVTLWICVGYLWELAGHRHCGRRFADSYGTGCLATMETMAQRMDRVVVGYDAYNIWD